MKLDYYRTIDPGLTIGVSKGWPAAAGMLDKPDKSLRLAHLDTTSADPYVDIMSKRIVIHCDMRLVATIALALIEAPDGKARFDALFTACPLRTSDFMQEAIEWTANYPDDRLVAGLVAA